MARGNAGNTDMRTITRPRLLTGAAALALTAALGASPGHAGSDSGTMNVSASVAQSCTMGTVGDLDFGQFTPGNEVNTSTTFVVNCDFGGSVDIEVGPGTHGSVPRKITNTTDGTKITYTLFQEDESTVWGDNVETRTVTAGDNPFDIFGNINSSNSGTATVGTYSDEVTITVTF